jgi:uncharacterized protein YndB with AHSA1/START domain
MSEGVRRGTGQDRHEWFALLDEWGAAGRPFREIARWLTGEHGMSRWWAQKLIVEYEQTRGLRAPGARPDGTFEVGASKMIAVPVDRLFEIVTDVDLLERWLPGVVLEARSAETPRVARYGWPDGASRVAFEFVATGEGRSQVTVLHQRIPDAAATAELKTFWRERLGVLTSLIEETR